MDDPYENFESWYLREHPRVVSAVAAITGRPSLAADAADEAFTRACERWRPDVAQLLDELAELPERPPASPRPVAEIHRRAHGRRRRRRARRTALTAAVLAVAGIVGVLGAPHTGGSREDVDLGPVAPPEDPSAAPPTTVDEDGTVRVLESRGLAVDPSDDLADGQRVVLALNSDPGGPVEVTQCLAEVVEHTGSVDPSAGRWCGSTFYLRDAAGVPDMGFEVSRWMGRGATVDCADAPGRCVLVARSTTPSRPGVGATGEARAAGAVARRYAPLAFRDDLPAPPLPEAGLVGVDGPIEDGRIVRLEASGLGPGAEVSVAQCTGPAEDLVAGGRGLGERCDGVRPARVRAGEAGAVTADVRIFHDVGLVDPTGMATEPTWTPCSPCSLVVSGDGPGLVVLPLELVPADDPIRPAMAVSPAGPHRVGDALRIEGSGFQVATDAEIGLCATTTPPGEAPTCSYSFVTADAGGAFVIEGYSLGTLEAGLARCGDGPGSCMLSWQVDGKPLGADVPLDVE